MKDEKISKAPEAFTIVIEVIRAIRDGAIEKVDISPSLAPDRKVSKTCIFLKSPKATIMRIKHGTM